MNITYGKLVLFRAVTVLISMFLLHQITIPFDLIALVIGIWVTAPWMRVVIVALEFFNLMLAVLSGFFGNIPGAILGIVVSGLCIYGVCAPGVKERFEQE